MKPWSKLLPKLWRRQRGRCHFCNARTFMWRDALQIPGATLSGSGKTIWIGEHSYAAATVEHVVRRSEGGARRGENCVMACASCNNRRDDAVQKAKARGRWAE